MAIREIGCCGAYCRTCRAYRAPCGGCISGYETGERDIRKARCQIKVCCVTRGHPTCADCPEFGHCRTLCGFHGKNGYKYGKYREALVFIREKGPAAFVTIADRWTGACGRYPRPAGEAAHNAVAAVGAAAGKSRKVTAPARRRPRRLSARRSTDTF
jgi:hypothetical protein